MKHCLLLLIFTVQLSAAAAPSPAVKSWLDAQTNLQTWSADLTQTRTLQSLTGPLTATGHVWFAAPDKFRWELGRPPQTIAICTGTNLLLVYPRLKRAESIPLTGLQTGPWRSALDMLEAGFPRSQRELEDHYTILSQTVTNQICVLQLRPRTAAARQMVSRLEIDINTAGNSLSGTELEFSDGSTMRNDFYNVVLNPALDNTVLSTTVPSDYTIVQPMGQ
jgi:outer membrane lipoprotein-sorting protein